MKNKIRVIAMSGRKQSGKDSASDYIQSVINKPTAKISFASPLKNICQDLFGLSYEQCWGTDEDKNTWTECKHPDTGEPITARQTMQIFGTDMCRKLNNDVWVSRAMQDVRDALTPEQGFDFVHIVDARFFNEVEAIKNRTDSYLIKIERPGFERNDEHISETALDHLPDEYYDYVIKATNLEELYSKCQIIIKELKLI